MNHIALPKPKAAWQTLGAVISLFFPMIARLLFSAEFVRDDTRTIWIADAHRDGKRFDVRADEKLTAFLELQWGMCIHLLTEGAQVADLFPARGMHAREPMNGSRQRSRYRHSNCTSQLRSDSAVRSDSLSVRHRLTLFSSARSSRARARGEAVNNAPSMSLIAVASAAAATPMASSPPKHAS